MFKKKFYKSIKNVFLLVLLLSFISACNGKLPGGDARKFPDDPKKRVQQNLKEGRGFKLDNTLFNGNGSRGGDFEFASSNELWKASLDTIDFMPLTSVNYSGGIIITDWYTTETNLNESIKISIRFLTNEIRSDALDIKIFKKLCKNNSFDCSIVESDSVLIAELKKEILKKATIYKNEEDKKKE